MPKLERKFPMSGLEAL